MRYLLALIASTIIGLGAAHADWPIKEWAVLEKNHKEPTGRRKFIAKKYKDSLERGSVWYESMGFRPPYQNKTKDGTKYLALLNKNNTEAGSSHDSYGEMELATYPGFLVAQSSTDILLSAAAVHELFHGIQKANKNYHNYINIEPLPKGPPECGIDNSRGDQWLTEGSASAVQIQYLEHTLGYNYGHAFKGSNRATWVRYFDQPLDWPRLYQTEMKGHPPLSWQCDYGTWYFWYAIGNMLGSEHPRDPRRTTYLRHIFEQKGEWEDTGVAMVDSGLKIAAKKMDAIELYQGGLFSIYPEFVAQYLDVDDFYEEVSHVNLNIPSLYESKNTHTNIRTNEKALEPLAARAWRFKIQPQQNATPISHTVRFVLESHHPNGLDSLHLIVDNKVVDRPVKANTPYSHTRYTDKDKPNDEGELEYFVRIANVGHNPAKTTPADFTLRVEVEGFYGETSPINSSTTASTAPLPPGFDISGPGKYWNCSGGDDARASFTIITPDGHAEQLERVLPQGLKNINNDFNYLERQEQTKGQDGQLEHIQQERKKFESQMQAMLKNSSINENITMAAEEIRSSDETDILAKLYGTNSAGPCSVMFSVTLPGRQPAAQTVSGEFFDIMIRPESTSHAIADIVEDPDIDWTSCSSNEKNCNIGKLHLEHAQYDHLSGSFNFQVSQLDDDTNKREYRDVTGFINITSAQTESDNNLLDFMSRGQQLGEPFYVPGIEKLLQGGSMFEE